MSNILLKLKMLKSLFLTLELIIKKFSERDKTCRRCEVPGGLAGCEGDFVQPAADEGLVVGRAGREARRDGDEAGGLAGHLLAPGGGDQVGVVVVAEAGDEALPPATTLRPEVRVVGVEARRPGRTSRHRHGRPRGPQARRPVGVGGEAGPGEVEHGRGGDGNDSAGDDVGGAVLRDGPEVLVVYVVVPHAGALTDLPWDSPLLLIVNINHLMQG